MIQLTKKILVLSLIIYVLNLIIAYGLDKIYENSYSNYIGSNLNYYLKTQQSDTLIVGSSCSLHHLDPNDFGKNSFNLSQQGMHLGYQTAVIDILYHAKKLPSKLLLLHVEAEDIYLKPENVIYRDIRWLNYYYDKNDFVKNNINLITKYEFLKYYFSSFRHNRNVMKLISNLLKNGKKHPENRGFIPLQSTKLDSVRIDFTLEHETTTKDSTINSTAIQFISHIQNICNKERIKLIIFTAPYFRTHKKLQTASKELDKILKRKKIHYINYVNADLHLNKRKYWYDNYHLNARGAKIFSKIVAGDILKLK